uniref:Dynein light chain n=1 Tax=Elaeis guineensis var. tenera TaxID=51953 RepID=A0A6J0PCA3_ELAGV|nr:dynein light chain LC6, flagellar outer arm-like [Elaeis guineensis]
MLEGKATFQDTNMPLKMQLHDMSSTSEALDLFDVLDCRSIAAHIKKEFDMIYGASWQCVMGSSFSSFFTHMQGTFIYFNLESLEFLNFKDFAA